MQIAGQPRALILARGLQVQRQRGEVGGAFCNLQLQPFAHRALQFLLNQALLGQRKGLVPQ